MATYRQPGKGDGTPEAQTVYVAGMLNDFVWATSTMPVTKVVCTVDGTKFGTTTIATPGLPRGCGDPGIVRFGLSTAERAYGPGGPHRWSGVPRLPNGWAERRPPTCREPA